jgi:hypothetical protein
MKESVEADWTRGEAMSRTRRRAWVEMRSAGAIIEFVAVSCLAFSGSALASSAPSINGTSASNITEHDATLEAEINPNGLVAAYEFEIDTNGSYNYTKSACPLDSCLAINAGEPLPAGLVEPQPEEISAGSGDRSVSLDLAKIGTTLQAATTYHYRVLAANGSSPTVEGPDETFTTTTQLTPSGQAKTEPLPSSGGVDQPGTSSTQAGLGGSSASGVMPPGTGSVCLCDCARGCHGKKVDHKHPTRTQRLAKALRTCERKSKHTRMICEAVARRTYRA